MKKRITTQSVVELRVRVNTGTYGPECTMDQILSQAATEGVQLVRSLLVRNDTVKGVIVGEPKVITTTTDEAGIE